MRSPCSLLQTEQNHVLQPIFIEDAPFDLHGPPLDSLQQLDIFPVLRASDLNAVLQIEPHKGRVEGGDPLPFHISHPSNAAWILLAMWPVPFFTYFFQHLSSCHLQLKCLPLLGSGSSSLMDCEEPSEFPCISPQQEEFYDLTKQNRIQKKSEEMRRIRLQKQYVMPQPLPESRTQHGTDAARDVCK